MAIQTVFLTKERFAQMGFEVPCGVCLEGPNVTDAKVQRIAELLANRNSDRTILPSVLLNEKIQASPEHIISRKKARSNWEAPIPCRLGILIPPSAKDRIGIIQKVLTSFGTPFREDATSTQKQQALIDYGNLIQKHNIQVRQIKRSK